MMLDRKKLGVSQAELAEIIGVSRPTLSKIEKGERSLKLVEKKRLEDFESRQIDLPKDVRINIPQKNITKFKQIFLYILEKIGAKPNIGQTVLYKLLYFIDFDYYEKHKKQIMGLTYFKNTYGPVPREFKKVIDEMIINQELEAVSSKHFKYDQKKYLPLKKSDLGDLTANELAMIDSVLVRYSDKSATEISEMSHRDTPWRVAKKNENLEYEHAFYRPDEFSVGDYEPL